MIEYIALDPEVINAMGEIVRHIPLHPLLYLAAAAVARLAHKHMWLVYLVFAGAVLLDGHG